MARAVDAVELLKHKRKVKFFGLGSEDESWGFAVPVEIIEKAPTITQPNEPAGLYSKFTVIKNSTGERVLDCFVLRPDRDPAARAALQKYAAATDNQELARDILRWIGGSEQQEPLTLDELRQMDGQPVYIISAIGERPEWYIVDTEENELKNPWDSVSLESWDEGYPYTAYRRPPEGEENT